jgi:chromosome segregation protein
MHLRSIALKGFKSFPDRTRLDFAPGVSVIVGPNGSGKSNVTDAVLWALGEQSPLAVRGQTMQDVIFAGGHGLPSRKAAEVEIVIDNSGGALASDFSEISIVRRLERSGEGEYRMNGARCRLVDVIEVLSDTGLGKEMHSVVSQGRVEAIIHSKPRDRRLLIEEAAGLGKHRKRRRRAQLKLERTQDNLDRALDVEREARSRLRPLKRQAEAAELHERLERQSLEARLELARDTVGSTGRELAAAEAAAASARAELAAAEHELAAVAKRREEVEEAFAEHSREREEISGRLYAARSAVERIGMRLDRACEVGRAAADGAVRRARELEDLEAERARPADSAGRERIAALESELAALEGEREERLGVELASLEQQRASSDRRCDELAAVAEQRRSELAEAERAGEAARTRRIESEAELESARRRAADAGAELAAVNQFLRAAAAAPEGTRSLAGELGVAGGYELALAAALGPLLGAGVVPDLRAAESLLDRADGASALIASGSAAGSHAPPPAPGARRLLDLVTPPPDLRPIAERLLADAWVVDSLESLPESFTGIAATRAGRVLFASTGELRQAAPGAADRVLEERNRRERLVAASERAAGEEGALRQAVEQAREAVHAAYAARDTAEGGLRGAVRQAEEAAEEVRRAEWLIERRRRAPDEGPSAVRHAELAAELRAERRMVEQIDRERAERRRRIEGLRSRIEHDGAVERDAERTVAALELSQASVSAHRDALAGALQADVEVGERTAAELRACARQEVELQARLRRANEAVTQAEVRAQQVRDAAGEARQELHGIARRLGFEDVQPLEEALDEDRRGELEGRVERLARRREQLGPVNPLAKQEYDEAVAHVEELETQRRDLEAALAELEGLIRDTDQRIRESFESTFESAARNFEDVVSHLFPGGRGRLRLVQPDGPRPVLGGEEPSEGDAAEDAPDASEPGVEIEVTPAGKSTKRLSLMSGGEKSLVALAFLFAVFLARPCPFYILDEVEAALDDVNIDRFLELVRRYSDRAQFIIVTHQKRTMDAADCLYGVSMGGDGVSKVVSRRLPRDEGIEAVADTADPEASSQAA